MQSSPDDRDLPIDLVGVSGLRYPIRVRDRTRKWAQTVAELSLSANLPHHFKGTHMSRFIEVVHAHRDELDMESMPAIVSAIRARLEAERARLEVKFPYFRERVAPVSGARSLMSYDCRYLAEETPDGNDFILSVRTPITTLCPCSKAVADYGAHNQRGYVEISVRAARAENGKPRLIWIEELADAAENAGSAPVVPLLKREDERWVTMQAYDNPAFVEDVVRGVVSVLKDDDRVDWLKVRVETLESIHDHSAFAVIEWKRPAPLSRH